MRLKDPHKKVRHLLQSGHFEAYFLLRKIDLGIL